MLIGPFDTCSSTWNARANRAIDAKKIWASVIVVTVTY